MSDPVPVGPPQDGPRLTEDEWLRSQCLERAIYSSNHNLPQATDAAEIVGRAEIFYDFIRNGGDGARRSAAVGRAADMDWKTRGI